MSATQNRWAVIVGIDKYPSFSPEGQLEGCVRDAQEMSRVLRERFGFPGKRMKVLLNDEARRDSIMGALEDLERWVKEDDVVVVHYSGHGSQRRLPAEDRSEPDGMEEVLVPYDTGHADPFPNRDISGSWIHGWLARVTKITPYVTLILDCCHSGTAHRADSSGVKIRRVPPDLRTPEGKNRIRIRDFKGGPKDFTRYVVLAACRNKESAYEIDDGGKSHGAMSFFLLEELRKLPLGACPTYRDVFEPVMTQVHNLNYKRQLPQLEGLRDRELFGLAELKPRRFVPVRDRRADRVVLGAGATCGLAEKAVLTVYPPQERQGTSLNAPIGKIEIIEVRAVTSTARILEEVRPDAIGPWARAVGENLGEDLFHLSPDAVGSLDLWARYRKILGLRNDDSQLARKVDFEVARMSSGRWIRIEDGEELAPGAPISFAVTNRASIPLFIHVLDFGLTGNISLVYPSPGANDPLLPGRCIEIGTRPEEEITLYVPEGVEEGEEILKVFITTREADLEPLFQSGQAQHGAHARPTRATTRGNTRDFQRSSEMDQLPAEDWSTLEHRFLVKRRVWRAGCSQ